MADFECTGMQKMLQQGFSETIRCVLDVFDHDKLQRHYLCNGIQELRKTLTLLLEGHAKCSSTGRVG